MHPGDQSHAAARPPRGHRLYRYTSGCRMPHRHTNAARTLPRAGAWRARCIGRGRVRRDVARHPRAKTTRVIGPIQTSALGPGTDVPRIPAYSPVATAASQAAGRVLKKRPNTRDLVCRPNSTSIISWSTSTLATLSAASRISGPYGIYAAIHTTSARTVSDVLPVLLPLAAPGKRQRARRAGLPRQILLCVHRCGFRGNAF